MVWFWNHWIGDPVEMSGNLVDRVCLIIKTDGRMCSPIKEWRRDCAALYKTE
jgi:hypothetical protein